MDRKRTALFLLILLICSVMFFLRNHRQSSSPATQTQRLNVVTSFYPLYYFVKQIGGNNIQVTNLTPPGAEPHDFEPNTQDIAAIEHSRLLILNGGGLESWGEKVTGELGNTHVKVVSAADGLTTLQTGEEGQKMQDPHVWLDPVLAGKEVTAITNGLIAVDPGNQTVYEQRAQKLHETLSTLDHDYSQGLSQCSQTSVVTSHAAFGYLAQQYKFTQIAIAGVSPDEEPSPQKLAEITTLVKRNKIRYIFFETLVSPRLSQTIASETGAGTLVFDPLEGVTKEEQDKGEDYFTIQRQNLKNLQTALECH